MENFLDRLTLDPLAYIALSLRKLDCNIFNISQSEKKEIIDNLSFYIIEKLTYNGYGTTIPQAKRLAKKYIYLFEKRDKKYYGK